MQKYRKICVITSVHPFLDKRIFNREILSLKKFGYEVDLIAPSAIEHQEIQEINIFGIPKRKKIFRFLNWAKILKLAFREKYSAYHFHDPDLLLVGILLKWIARKPVIYDVHEHDAIVIFCNANKRKGIIRWMLNLAGVAFVVLQNIAAKIIGNIVVVEDSMQKRFGALGCNVIILYNYAKKRDFIEEPALEIKRPIIIHTGVLSERRGSKMLLEIAQIIAIKYPEWKFVIVDKFSSNGEKVRFIEELGIKKLCSSVVIVPPVPPLEMHGLLRDASIGLSILLPEGPLEKGIPTKFFEYMASGVVIVASNLHYSCAYVGDNNIGLLSNPYNLQGYANSIIKLIEDVYMRQTMAQKGRRLFLEHYNWESQEGKLFEFYNKAIKCSATKSLINKTNLLLFIRNNMQNLPYFLGKLVSFVPFAHRPGIEKIYRARLKDIQYFEYYSAKDKKKYIFTRMYDLVQYAIDNVPFYREYYHNCGFQLSYLKAFDDIEKIPIISKPLLMKYDIEYRSNKNNNRYKVNTGGSSGQTLSFYILPKSIAHEWAHMHKIWSKCGYKQFNLKLVFGGRSDIKDQIQYDFVRHSYIIDIYADFQLMKEKLNKLLMKRRISFLHGYPSAIYQFAIACETDQEILDLVQKNLKGIFLGSEYPAPKYRVKIESVFRVPTISWYGHTERCVLAYEKNCQFEYCPFQTYGFAEAIKNGNGNYDLVGTSYYNTASPFIRYNTEDEIGDVSYVDDLLSSFKIVGGRRGEFILDKSGIVIPLTGLIFGRHHKLFDFCTHIQVQQKDPGFATILYSSNEPLRNEKKLFDSSNVNIEFSFKWLDKPIKTAVGKTPLLVINHARK